MHFPTSSVFPPDLLWIKPVCDDIVLFIFDFYLVHENILNIKFSWHFLMSQQLADTVPVGSAAGRHGAGRLCSPVDTVPVGSAAQ